MKKYILAFCIIWFSKIVLPLPAADINDLIYSVSNEFVTITGCDVSASGELSIPDTIEGKPVTRIGIAALRDCVGLTAVTIPASVTHLYSQAFRDCSGMTAVMIPESVVFIAESAFAGCSSLVTLTIPDSVTSIGAGAFYECSGITSLHIGTGLESIGQMVFQGCSALTEVMIPDNVTEIETYAFRNCSSVTNVQIGNGVSTVGNRAFFNCPLDTLTIGSGVTDIDDSAFAVSAGFHRIDEVVFLGNDAPATGVNVFGAWGPFSIVVPTYATGWGVYKDAFEGVQLTSLAPFTYTIQDGNVTISGSSELYAGSVYIPPQIYGSPVTVIADSCFYDRHRISSISLPPGVDSIGYRAFMGSEIATILIPEEVTLIEANTFRECNKLAQVMLPGKLESIEAYAFQGMPRITDITIPAAVTDIGNKVFNGCNALSKIIFLGDAPSLGTDVFLAVAPDAVVYYMPSKGGFTSSFAGVPSQSLLTYVTGDDSVTITDCISEVAGKIVLPDSIGGKPVTAIANEAFSGCSNITSVTIPDSITSIGDRAFFSCTGLKIVHFAGSIPDYVAYDAFENSPNAIVVSPDASAGNMIGSVPVMNVAAVGLHRPDEMAEKDAEIASQDIQIAELSQRPTIAELQDARVGSILLSKDWQTGEVSLCFGLEKTDDFVSWEAFEDGTWTNATNGEVKLALPLGETKKWLRLTLTD
jgi:hypothetical protein